ncbi:MAG: hypothetical protein KKD38_10545 [Candidatus Delongbacteria bacterium]|nr:hypothetical protein [Candidatus Delongbacteria bacterium]MCG2760099.1 hypothetical protein [Candidatus Delongbacteria bacterium]
MTEEIKNGEDTAQEVGIEPDEVVKNTREPEEENEESLTIIEKFFRLEMETKIGLTATLVFLLALIFRWNWFNLTWWLVLILGIIGIKTLYTQMTDLKDEKSSEAKVAKYSFYTLVTLLVIRDLYITSYLSDMVSYLPMK